MLHPKLCHDVIWSNIEEYWSISGCFTPQKVLSSCNKFHSTVHWLSSLLTSISIAKDTGLCVKPWPFNVLNLYIHHQPHKAIPEESQLWSGWLKDQQKIEQNASRYKHSRPSWVGCELGATSALSTFRSQRQPKSTWGQHPFLGDPIKSVAKFRLKLY